MTRRPVLAGLVALSLLAPGLANGQELPQVSLEGFAAVDWYQYTKKERDAVPAVAQLRLAPRLRAKYRFLRAALQVELRHDFFDSGRGGRVILREATLGLRSHGIRVEAGALLPRWGKMDIASPTDNLVAWDYEELLQPEALPVPGFLLGFARGPFSIQGLLIPAFVPSRFRYDAPSRWDNTWGLPSSQAVPGPFGDLIFANSYERFADPVAIGRPENMTRSWEAGLRADLFLPNVDVGLSFAATRDKLPSYNGFTTFNSEDYNGNGTPDHLESSTGRLEITSYHGRIFVPGLDLAVSAGPLVIKGELAYFATGDPKHENCLVDDPYIKAALGVEFLLNNLAGGMDLAIRAQYNLDQEVKKGGDLVFNQADRCQVITSESGSSLLSATDYESGFQGTPNIRHPYVHAIYYNVNLAITPQLAFDWRGFVSLPAKDGDPGSDDGDGKGALSGGDVLFMPSLQYTFLGHLTIRAGGLILPVVAGEVGGSAEGFRCRGETPSSEGESTFFADYRCNNRFEIGLRYDF